VALLTAGSLVRVQQSEPAKKPSESKSSSGREAGATAAVCTSVCTTPEERELEHRIVAAELDGRKTVADVLARELDNFRGRRPDIVVELAARKREA
jgi:hypothetical protein